MKLRRSYNGCPSVETGMDVLERLGLLEQDAEDCMDAGGRVGQEPELLMDGEQDLVPCVS